MSQSIIRAVAGTMESSDVYAELEPADGLHVEVDSVVYRQFGEEIRRVAMEVLAEKGIDNARLRLVDRGALSCVIRARVETVADRAKGEE